MMEYGKKYHNSILWVKLCKGDGLTRISFDWGDPGRIKFEDNLERLCRKGLIDKETRYRGMLKYYIRVKKNFIWEKRKVVAPIINVDCYHMNY